MRRPHRGARATRGSSTSPDDTRELTLLAAARLGIPARRLRALTRGDAGGVRAWIAGDAARRLAEARRDARLDLARLRACGARLVALGDPEYPPGFDDLSDPPAFLTVRGVLPAGGVAVIGTRTPTADAEVFARAFAAALPVPLVSGLARGIDAAAHRSACEIARAQVAYVATGIASTYPPEHAELAAAIVAAGGAIASERRIDDPVSRWALVRRDRLQAAHADAVVLVESEIDGGAMVTMRDARRLGRPRFVAPFEAEGNRRAAEEGAVVLPRDARAAAARVVSARAPEGREP